MYSLFLIYVLDLWVKLLMNWWNKNITHYVILFEPVRKRGVQSLSLCLLFITTQIPPVIHFLINHRIRSLSDVDHCFDTELSCLVNDLYLCSQKATGEVSCPNYNLAKEWINIIFYYNLCFLCIFAGSLPHNTNHLEELLLWFNAIQIKLSSSYRKDGIV